MLTVLTVLSALVLTPGVIRRRQKLDAPTLNPDCHEYPLDGLDHFGTEKPRP